MQGSTKTVGGGNAVPTADAYNQFLRNTITGTGGSGGGFNTALTTMLGGGPKVDTNNGMANLPNAPSFASTNFMPLNNTLSVNPDVLSPRAVTIKNIIDRQNQLDVANTRARYSAGGMGGFGSGASLAEAQTRGNNQDRLLAGLQGVTQQDIENALNIGNFNNTATQQNNQNQFNEHNALNTFMSSLFGQQSGNALQNQYLGNNFGLGAAGQQSSNIMNVLNQIFGGLNGANQLGTPQAQTVRTPSIFSQVAGGLGAIAPYALAPFTGGASLGLGSMGGFGGGFNMGNAASMFAPNSMRFGVPSQVSGFGGVPSVPMFS